MYIKNGEQFICWILSKNKERLQKRLMKDIKIFLKKKKKKIMIMVVSDIKISPKINWLSLGKIALKSKKTLHSNQVLYHFLIVLPAA